MTDCGRKIESKLTNNRYPHFPFGNPNTKRKESEQPGR
jgi:hypothetical protein